MPLAMGYLIGVYGVVGRWMLQYSLEVCWIKYCLISLLRDNMDYVSSGVDRSESGLLKYSIEYERYLIFF